MRLAQLVTGPGGLVLVLALGAYLRLAGLEYAQFRYDDVTLWNIVRDLAHNPAILSRGMISSFGVANGPVQAYLLLPGALATPDPFGAYYVVALLNIVALVLFALFVRRFWGPRVGLLAALLYAVNPWAVVFSRRLWGNDMIAPFNILLIWSLCDLVQHGRRRDSVLPLFWLGVVIQTYVVALVHLPLAALGMALGARRLRALPLVAGVLLLGLMTAPYVIGTIWPSLSSLAVVFGVAVKAPTVDTDSLFFAFHVVSSAGYQAFANQAGGILDAETGLPALASLITQALLALGMLAAVAELARQLRRRALAQAMPFLLLLTAVLLPVLLLVRHSAPVFPQYMLTGLPMHFLFVALGFRVLWRAMKAPPSIPRGAIHRVLLGLIVSVLVFVVATHLVLAQVFFVAIQQYWPKSEYSLPLRYSVAVSNTVKKLAAELGLTKVYFGLSLEPDGTLFLALQRDFPVMSQFGTADSFVRPPDAAGKVLYVLSSAEDRVGKAFEQYLSDARVATLDLPGPGVRYSFFAARPQELTGLFPDAGSSALAVTFDNRVRLDGYTTPPELRPGETSAVALRWTLLADTSPVLPPYYVYVRLMDQGREADHGVEYVLYGAGQWQKGEQLNQWVDLRAPPDLTPGAYSYLVGLYTPTSSGYRNVPAVDASGASLTNGVPVGRVVMRRAGAPDPTNRLGVAFGDQISLTGYDLAVPSVSAGSLGIDLHWQALDRIARDYTAFVHLVAPDGKLVSQHDAQPDAARYPTTAWLPGDAIVDRHVVPLPASLAPGEYTVAVGLYYLPTGERLGGPAFAATFPLRLP